MPGYLLRRVKQVCTALSIEEFAGFDPRSVPFAALPSLDMNHGVDATRPSALIACHRSTIGDVVDLMENEGWIVRRSAQSDCGIKLIELSSGERILAPLAPADRSTSVRIVQQLLAEKAVTPERGA